jgi:hypothetical protein
VDHLVVPLEELGFVRAEQPEGAPDVADVERFVILVQDQDRCVDHGAPLSAR